MKHSRAALLTGLISLVAHALVLRLVSAPVPTRRAEASNEIEFTLLDPPPVAEPVAAPQSSAATPSPAPKRSAAQLTKQPRRTPQPEQLAIAAPEVVAETPPPATVLAPAKPKPLALDPRTVALGTMPLPVASQNDVEREASASLSANLYAAANRPFRGRSGPELQRDPDGTCHYAGTAIAATILPDGGVEFRDRAPETNVGWGVGEPSARPTTPEDQRAPQRLQVGMKAQGRAWEDERDWFLRETKELRTQLSDAARDRELAEDDLHLRGQLHRVWCDVKLSYEERHRRIFKLWDDTSPDEIGARARRVVVEFVREHVAVNGAQAFTRAELVRFNEGREQRERFEPYAGGDAGAAPN